MLIRLGERKISYDLIGPERGEVVCMAHCLSADSGVWVEQLPALLEQGWRVLRLDMRGHGGSEPTTGGCRMSDLAHDVVQTLDALNIPAAHFVGVSIGGMIGQVLGIERPGRFKSLTLCGTSPKAVPGGMDMWAARFAAVRKAGSLEPLADATMERWFTPTYRPRRPDLWRQLRDTVAATMPAGYMAGAEAIIAFDVLSDLPKVKAPTLVLCGDEDPGTPPDGNRRIAELIPGARYEELAHARHLPMMEHPERFNRILLDWLAARR
jgi:3-oxoadipate enol-lactonase